MYIHVTVRYNGYVRAIVRAQHFGECTMHFEIDWMENYANDPHINVRGVRFERGPATRPYERRNGIYRRDYHGCVSYFYSDGQPCSGFGGATFSGSLLDGTTFSLKGAWSSRAECVNREWPESPVVDVGFLDGNTAGAFHLAPLVNWWRRGRQPSWGLCSVVAGYGLIVRPTRSVGGVMRRKNEPKYETLVRHLTVDNHVEFLRDFMSRNTK